MKILHLNLKKKWWDEINAGQKKYEYRVFNNFWEKRLKNKEFDIILIKLGYPKKDDLSKIIAFKWEGYEIQYLKHEEFENKEQKVFAINLKKRVKLERNEI